MCVKRWWLRDHLGCNGCCGDYSPVNARLKILTVAMEAIHDKMAHLTEKTAK